MCYVYKKKFIQNLLPDVFLMETYVHPERGPRVIINHAVDHVQGRLVHFPGVQDAEFGQCRHQCTFHVRQCPFAIPVVHANAVLQRFFQRAIVHLVEN